jgi:hypothetical protein
LKCLVSVEWVVERRIVALVGEDLLLDIGDRWVQTSVLPAVRTRQQDKMEEKDEKVR